MVCYDMADPRRLARIFRLLKSNGIPLQYSVFLVHASSLEMDQLENKIKAIINPAEDDVRAYRIPLANRKVVLGHPLVPDGMLIGCGIDTL
ncbi:MAG: CRISPR-associated endonuclease Cas2 [Rhodoferax sp.]